MAKSVIEVTLDWQQVAAGAVLITVEQRGKGTLYINEVEDAATAYKTVAAPGVQLDQADSDVTHVRASGAGWKILVDGAL